jgi:dTDP-4-amino-4,6-dideoxygalactose transaminase
MKPRLEVKVPLSYQWQYWFGKEYNPMDNEFLLNHARTGIIMALKAVLSNGGKVGVVAYNCHTVANAVCNAGCEPVFVDVTEDLVVDVNHLTKLDLDAIVVTNLFGIPNDIEKISKAISNKPIIVDNAHGYGLPQEGDFTVYSINQGKFPSVGEGGILFVNNKDYIEPIKKEYQNLSKYGYVMRLILFIKMFVNACLYSSFLYSITYKLKQKRSVDSNVHSVVHLKQMSYNIRKIYNYSLPTVPKQISERKANINEIVLKLKQLFDIKKYLVGDNAFMLIVQSENVEELKQYFKSKNIETETHFKNAINWAKQFGYKEGMCPTTEKLITELLMIPVYK